MKLVVVAAFVVVNAVGFLVYRAAYSPDAAAGSLMTSKHQAADNLSRDEGVSQAKVATPDKPAVAAEVTSEPHVAAPAISAEQPSVVENTNSPTEETTSSTRTRTRVKQPVRKRVEDAPAKPAVVAKPVETAKPAETTKPAESKPPVETKPAETKPADKAKDKVLEMEANPYKRGE